MRSLCKYIIIMFFIGCGCSQRVHIPPNKVDYIKFYTTNRSFERNSSIRSFDFFVEWNRDSLASGSLCRDTILRDKSSIQRFVSLVNSLQKSDNPNYDLRTAAFIYLVNGSVIHVGFGYRFGICIEGIAMDYNEDLFQFLENSIYKSHPPEYWMGEWLRDLTQGEIGLSI